VSDLSVGARKFKRTISEVNAKVEAARRAVRELLQSNASPERTLALDLARQETNNMVDLTKVQISKGAEELTLEQRNALERDWLVSVWCTLSDFMQMAAGHYQGSRPIEASLKVCF